MNRSLDELTASELNAAIDDTNFPKARSTSISSQGDESNANQNGTNHATSPLNGNDDDNENDHAKLAKSDAQQQSTAESTTNGKGFIKRAHPAPLKMVAFKGDSIDVPGTPRTPRTSTTPGKHTH